MQVALGFQHTAALDAYGNVYTWGCGEQGQLGHGDKESASVPRRVLLDLDLTYTAAAATTATATQHTPPHAPEDTLASAGVAGVCCRAFRAFMPSQARNRAVIEPQ